MKIKQFCKIIAQAQQKWETSGGDFLSWLSYYDLKQKAYLELIEQVPEVSGIERIWTLINNSPPGRWEIVIEGQIKAIRSGVPCEDCGKVVTFPAKRCGECAETYRQLLEEKKAIKKKLNRKR